MCNLTRRELEQRIVQHLRLIPNQPNRFQEMLRLRQFTSPTDSVPQARHATPCTESGQDSQRMNGMHLNGYDSPYRDGSPQHEDSATQTATVTQQDLIRFMDANKLGSHAVKRSASPTYDTHSDNDTAIVKELLQWQLKHHQREARTAPIQHGIGSTNGSHNSKVASANAQLSLSHILGTQGMGTMHHIEHTLAEIMSGSNPSSRLRVQEWCDTVLPQSHARPVQAALQVHDYDEISPTSTAGFSSHDTAHRIPTEVTTCASSGTSSIRRDVTDLAALLASTTPNVSVLQPAFTAEELQLLKKLAGSLLNATEPTTRMP